MKLHHVAMVGVVATFFTLPMYSATGSNSATQPLGGQREAMRMVPAQAELVQTLDSKKTPPGYKFEARLASTVHLDNGVELPRGTMLEGTVATDDMQVNGMSKLALRFTKATTKSGEVVPIKATIVGIDRAEEMDAESDQATNDWTDKTLAVDQEGVLPGVDLHSRISSRNSGVLVSTDKDKMTLHSGSEIELAIAARS